MAASGGLPVGAGPGFPSVPLDKGEVARLVAVQTSGLRKVGGRGARPEIALHSAEVLWIECSLLWKWGGGRLGGECWLELASASN